MPNKSGLGWGIRSLTALERAGDRLPHPVALFGWLMAFIAAGSWFAHRLGWQASVTGNVEPIVARSLLSADGVRWALTHAVENFIGFAPVGAVLVIMLGLGVAERSGLLKVLLVRLVAAVSERYLATIVVLTGILSNLAFDVGYVVLIPLAGALYHAAGRHPLAGIAAAFAGVSAGYSANIALGPADVILAGMSTEAIALVHSESYVSVGANYYFLAASTPLLAILGGWVTDKVVEPYLGPWSDAELGPDAVVVAPAADGNGQALRWVGVWTVLFAVLALLLVVPSGAPFSAGAASDGSPLRALVPAIALYAALAGLIYGKVSGQFQKPGDATRGMESAMASLAGYLVLMFFAAQAVAWFGWSNLGVLVATAGAQWLHAFEEQPILLLMLFIVISALINLFVGSASAKWGLLGPVFVPMLFFLGVAPEKTQMAFRIGDSVTNIITPLMPYFGVVLAFAARYRPGIGVGGMLAMMVPYSITFFVGWSLFFTAWLALAWPLGF
ncbi:AbgT family transporter [Gilvimarinus sp. SDUM040013]|uniref:AbgT family transporter n=1 Tax=Gilvimarinus gilvus TaxID=3058038 RepID=A0ABU4RU24_9GAMM|nr:AbgT family transporter [Gilvimarinus sp. SDUM040013]MDO3386942.1 AbgT family transporter [Gilvimarinus sp. SDUM040013]MDX6848164.1 AbgT family transporter [Gilvimarinus sp. SDUM040013]